MLFVNILDIEKLSNMFSNLASSSDEIEIRLKLLLCEMLDDQEFKTFVESSYVTSQLQEVLKHISVGNERLLALKNCLTTVPTDYSENEKKYINLIRNITTKFDYSKTNLEDAIVTKIIPEIYVKDLNVHSVSDIQHLVANSASEMQFVNIAEISRVIKDEYNINEVRDLSD